jgi:small-conductance mechanosensitive channel
MWEEAKAWVLANAVTLLRAGGVLAAGLLLAGLLRRLLRRALAAPFGHQTAAAIGKVARNFVVILSALSVLWEFGVKLNALLAAAGVAGVAIGFAAQTSLSNLISGVFLLGERAFRIGDVLTVGDTTGVVQQVGLLATQLRTFDNRLVRLPNELLVKTPIVNVTRFPVRRLDLPIGVARKEDVGRVMAALAGVADAHPLCLDEPKPLVIFNGFGASSMDFTLAVWFEKSDLLALRSSLLRDIKERFDREGIEIPFPHVTLHTGATTAPFPIALEDRRRANLGACAAPVQPGVTTDKERDS